jgi:hypothetical protein
MNPITLFYTIVRNSKNILEAAGVLYVTLNKVLEILNFLETKSNDTKLGKILEQYLPVLISVITKIVNMFTKYGKYVGFVAPATVQSDGADEDELKKHLLDLSDKLDKY